MNKRIIHNITLTVKAKQLKEQREPEVDYCATVRKDNRALLAVVVILSILSFVVTNTVIVYLKNVPDDEPNLTVQQYLGEDTEIKYHISTEDMNTTETVLVNPPVMFNDGQSINISLDQHQLVKRSAANASDTWHFDNNEETGILTLHGPPVKCTSNGTYVTQFFDRNSTLILVVNVTLIVKSKIGDPKLTVEQSADIENNLTCVQSFGCSRLEMQISLEIDDKEVLTQAQDSCKTFNDNEGYTGKVTTSMSNKLAKLPRAITCKSHGNIDNVDEMPGKESVIVIGDTCDPKTCSFNCSRRFGPDFYFADKERCDTFWRCSFGKLQRLNSPLDTYFDARVTVCANQHKDTLPWCNNDGSVKVDSDLTDHVCGYDQNG